MKNNNNEKGVIMCRIVKIVIGGLLLPIVTTPTPAWAYAFNVNVNTASLFGTTATLAFDFTNGDIAVNNKVQISNFSTDGSFTPTDGDGTDDVSGLLDSSVIMTDNTLFFNEFLQPITLGNSFQFQLETTNEFAAGATFPDSFAFFIFNSSGVPLFATTDPTTADALFALDLTGTGSGNLSVFEPVSTGPTWSVVSVQNIPEPGSLGLMLIGGWSVYLRNKRNKKL
jgi:hypothetical protein